MVPVEPMTRTANILIKKETEKNLHSSRREKIATIFCVWKIQNLDNKFASDVGQRGSRFYHIPPLKGRDDCIKIKEFSESSVWAPEKGSEGLLVVGLVNQL